MKINSRKHIFFFILFIVAQIIFLSLVIFNEEKLGNQQLIVLESIPVDPRDPLRGDFIILDYSATNLDHLPSPEITIGESIFIIFEQQSYYWEPIGIYKNKPLPSEISSENVFLKAIIQDVAPLHVEYPNIQKCFVPQGSGNIPENPDVIIAVSDKGLARIQRLEFTNPDGTGGIREC